MGGRNLFPEEVPPEKKEKKGRNLFATPEASSSPFLQKGMDMVSAAQASPQQPRTGKDGALDAKNERISAEQSVRRAIANQQKVERQMRVKPVEQAAGRAGKAQLDQGLTGVNPNAIYSEFMLPPDAQRGMDAEREVYRDKDVTSSVDAASLGLLNSTAGGLPGILNKDFRGELADASTDQPGAYMGGTVAGILPGSLGVWNAVRAPVNALAQRFVPQGADALSRFGRYAFPRAGEVAGVAGQNAYVQGAIMEPVRAEQAGEDYTVEGAANAAGQGFQDPLNLLPLGLSGVNRTWNALTSGIAAPSAKAAQVANQFGVGPRQTSASQGIAQTTQELGGQLQGRDIRGLTNIENALRFALRDNPNIPDVNTRIADGFQRIRQSLPLEDDPTLNLARLIEREFADDAPQTRDILRRFLSKVGQETPGGEAIVGGAANDIRGRQADVLEQEAMSVFGDQPKQDAKLVLEQNIDLLGEQTYGPIVRGATSAPPQAQQRATSMLNRRLETEDILFNRADREGLTVEQYVQRNPLEALHWVQSDLAKQARALRGANNPDTALEGVIQNMKTVLRDNVPSYREADALYASNAKSLDRLGTTRGADAGTQGELKYDPGFGERLLGGGGSAPAAARAEGRATARTVYDSMDEQSRRAAAISVRDIILDDLSKARAAGVDQRYEIAAKFQKLNSEGALQALVDVFGEGGQRIVNRIRQFVDANEFASAIDPLTGSNTMNKAQNMATGAQPFAGRMGQRAQGASNAFSESAIADSVLMLSGAPPIISAMRAPGIIGRMLQPGQRTQRNIAETLLRRGEIGSQVPPRPGGPPPITPIDPTSVPRGAAPANALAGAETPVSPAQPRNAFAGTNPHAERRLPGMPKTGLRPPPPKQTEAQIREAHERASSIHAPQAGRPPTAAQKELDRLSNEARTAEMEIQTLQDEIEEMGVNPAIFEDRRILPSDVSQNAWPRVQELMAKIDDAQARVIRAREEGRRVWDANQDELMPWTPRGPTRSSGFSGSETATNALAGAGLGAAGPADSNEDRARNALIGAGLGAAAGRILVRGMADDVTRGAGFGGPRAKGADLNALDFAKQQISDGADPREIWKATGWHQTRDGQWRFEIDDSQAAIADPEAKTLGKFIAHPTLFEFYPQLAKVKVRVDSSLGESAYYDRFANKIVMGRADLSAALHEIQHAMQKSEGRLGISNEAIFDYKKLVDAGIEPDIENGISRRENAYLRTLSETEARATQSRQALTAEGRADLFPEDSYDIPADSVLPTTKGLRKSWLEIWREAQTSQAKAPRPPKADSPDAIRNALKDIAKNKPKEPSRLERMVEEGKDAAVPPINPMPHELDALAAKAERMLEAGKPTIDIYDQTRVVMVPYNGGNVPIVSYEQGPEEVIRNFYGWLKEPASKRPAWVNEIVSKSPRKKGLLLTEASQTTPPASAAAPEMPPEKSGFPYGAVAVGMGAGAATGIPAGVLAGYAMTRDSKPRNALSGN